VNSRVRGGKSEKRRKEQEKNFREREVRQVKAKIDIWTEWRRE
jgi:DeoR/GlpR family transcriptional regulator of sugar metabolism